MAGKKIVIASDSFKGTLSSMDICGLYKEASKNHPSLSVSLLPLADGGEGSLETISDVLSGKFVQTKVYDLNFDERDVCFFLSGENAYIESAMVVGLSLRKDGGHPSDVTSFGIGQLIKASFGYGAKNVYVFLGGTATNDGGVGAASALGTKFYKKDENGELVSFVPVGRNLKDIVKVDNFECAKTLQNNNIFALCDVKSPFFGTEGAAYKFARQKGADYQEIEDLDKGLRHLSNVIKADLGNDIESLEGAGAAGGLGGGLYAFLGAKIVSGIEAVLNLTRFDETIDDADYVVSGEGKLDLQTLDGKVIDGVAKRCIAKGKPLILVVGTSELSLEEIKQMYPCVVALYETNGRHLGFDEIKGNAKEDYWKIIEILLDDLEAC